LGFEKAHDVIISALTAYIKNNWTNTVNFHISSTFHTISEKIDGYIHLFSRNKYIWKKINGFIHLFCP
jgi:hypothetical protein